MQIVPESERKEAEAMTYSHRCAVCQSGITLAWGGAFGIDSHILRCSQDVNHEGFEKPYRPRLAELGLPWIKASKKEVERMTQEHGGEVGAKLAPYMGSTALTKKQATFLVQTMWSKAPQEMKNQAIALCVMEQLNPLMKHVYILGPFKNKKTGAEDWALHVGRQAVRLMAGRRCDFGYIEERALTKQEIIDITGEDTYKEKLWVRVIVRDEKDMRFTGLGFVWRTDDIMGEEKGNSRFNMAAGRAERIALSKCTEGRSRVALPDLPVIDESFLPDIGQVEQAVARELLPVDRDTGEIKDVEAKAVEPETPQVVQAPSYLGGQYGDMIALCWEHGDPWTPDKFQHLCHSMPDKTFCHFRNLLKPIVEDIAMKVGTTVEEINEKVKAVNNGKTWSQLTEPRQLEILTILYSQIPKDKVIPKENGETSQGQMM